ncbi:zf-HC2 domain-containing protein [Streptomyces sp. A7024]|uniref:Zf-HC2 domain-containing protein n=1 Tax=Streptomyces coryli TaxID=1128680 RepID=A0A6G4U4L5_9ACTN|nr:zf-HC2 domain-containing protein [Streptomyces coryli]NGN66318.1 zf-HC2 domain-containing protein [Streptomyces coryli]
MTTAHADVGAYVLGVLDDADAARFEEHLAECAQCAAQLDELLPVAHLLGEAAPPGGPEAAAIAAPPGPVLLDRLLGEVAGERHRRRSRRMWLVAAAAALLIGVPLGTYAVTSEDGGGHVSAAQEMFDDGEKHRGVDEATHADATVSLLKKSWGTHVALKLGGVQGPLECDLVAVGKDGERQTVTTWSVPAAGYGEVHGDMKSEPLLTHGGTGLARKDIDRFEVRTLDGRKLVTVPL